ncbi:hypothetical protein EPI10_013679 [Gossypium australe]|uniref:Uncharacterized protein n=1 Tax=Gossypium australe TaxID=47621 RepID=A0A5B6UM65_9ROSI|nr:hypothetical protein EPI10_013679 [Gossypium australe]
MVSLERRGSPLSLDPERATKKVKNQYHRENDEDEMVLDETLPKRVSYKEMLMNRSDSQNEFDREDDVFLDDDEIFTHEDDVEICLDGKYPEISFSRHVNDLIDQIMKKTRSMNDLWSLSDYPALG